MIRLEQVHKRFGRVHAVRGVDLHIQAGQIVGMLGPNGAGKSTTVRMIAAAIPPSAGRVIIDGLDAVDDSPRVRARVGYLPEANPLYPELRVRDYLRFRAGLHSMTAKARRDAIDRVLERCWLTDVAARRVGQLSKGYRQRVGLAAALLHDPPVLILDEPTSGLDPSQIAETRSLIRELAGDRTMILVSHILPEVERTCDRIVVIGHGQVRADGPPDALLAQTERRLHVEVHAPAEDVRTALADLPGVRSLDTTARDAWTAYTLTLEPGADAREAVAHACHTRGWLVRELRLDTPTLEWLYLSLIDPDRAAHAPTSSTSGAMA
jgi:ABC-2 type transport system ATP-binding protein